MAPDSATLENRLTTRRISLVLLPTLASGCRPSPPPGRARQIWPLSRARKG